MTLIRKKTRVAVLLAMLLPLTTAFAQQEQPMKPKDAYRYAVVDTGEAIEVDWEVEPGYYLYREKMSYESGTTGLTLGNYTLPQGLEHEDEFFGKQQIYRDRFFVTIPYTISDDRPASVDLIIKSQGCADLGLCYPPQSWTETVELRAVSAKPKLDLGTLGSGGSGSGLGGLGGSDFLSMDDAFNPVLIPVDGNTVELSFRITPEHYVYKHKIAVSSETATVQLGQLQLPDGELKYDEFFGESEVYTEDVFARLPLARATPEAMTLDLSVSYQGCADAGLCYPPETRTLSVSLPEASTVTELSAVPPGAPVSEQAWYSNVITESSIWVAAGLFFLAGLGLAFTPCVLPMVPILSGIIAGEGDDVSPLRGFTLALSYVLGMALVYTAAGVAAGAAGLQLQAAFNQPWVLMVFAGLFVLLALGMFGAYDLQMPSAIQSKLANVSSNQKSGTTIGAFVMGALSALVVTACVAPALIGALTVIAQTGEMLRGGAALFAMSLGMGAPLLLVGAAQGHILPRVGGWMVAVKSAFGFMMLGLAIYMLSRILPGSVTMALWAILIFMGGVFMGGLTTLGSESSITQKLGKGFGLLAILYGLLLFLGSLTGGTNPLRPLASVSFGSGTAVVEDAHAQFVQIKTVDDLDREIAAANAQGKSAMLDFYADWCVSCKEMEAYTFPDPAVKNALSNTVLIQADVTRNDDEDKALLERFGVFGPPTIIFFDETGQQRHGYEVVGYMKAADFAQHVRSALADGAVIASNPSL